MTGRLRHGAPAPGPGPDAAVGRWRMLAVLSAAELLGMSLWFTASAISPQLRAVWTLDATEAAWLTTIVQLGFVAGTATAAVLNLADILPSRPYFAGAATLASASNAALLIAPGYGTALICRFLTGFFLAGVYPPGMKMVATWFREARGLAIGTLVGALTVGKATPYLVRAFGETSIAGVVLVPSAGAVLAALVVATSYRDGPFPFSRRPFSWALAGVVARHRPTRLATAGYLGHMWELYAMWTWLPAFVSASVASRNAAGFGPVSASALDLAAFAAIAAGGLGCLWGGWAADRIGRARVVNLSMAVSGSCSLAIGLFYGSSLWILVPLALVWGFFVVSDSAQFSALVTEVAPDHAVGTALTVQTSIGFLLTMATIQLVPVLADAVGWAWAFPALALGPAVGIAAIRRLQRARH